jgi:hypothetical protein
MTVNEAPCDIKSWTIAGHVGVECKTHDCRTEQWFPNEDAARQDFVCDKGDPKWFIVQWDEDQSVSAFDLTGIHAMLRSISYSAATDNPVHVDVWLWGSGGRLTPLLLTFDQPAFYQDDYATLTLKLMDVTTKTVYASVQQSVDGRS